MKKNIKNIYKHLFEINEDQSIDHPLINLTNKPYDMSSRLKKPELKNYFRQEEPEVVEEPEEVEVPVSQEEAIQERFKESIEKLLKESEVSFDVNILEEDIDGNEKISYTKKCSMTKFSLICYTYYCHKYLEGFSLNSGDLKKVLSESSSTKNSIGNIVSQNFATSSSRRSNVVSRVVDSSSLDEFKNNIFYFLYKKFYNPQAVLDVTSNISATINDIVDLFLNKLKDESQTALTVNFGSYFEELFREKVYNVLGKQASFNVDVKHKSKKLAIVLLFCCNKIFDNGGILRGNVVGPNTSAIYTSLSRGSRPTDADYSEDYRKIRFQGTGEADFERRVREIINNYTRLLNIQGNVYCDDYEKDPIFKNVAAANSPFDFIIREDDINNSNCHIGLFDLKATNKGSGSQPISKGATGSNGGTQNSALTFVSNFTKKLSKLNTNIGIGFFGLAQVSYELDFDPDNEWEVVLGSLKSIEMNALTSCTYSVDRPHFYLSNEDSIKNIENSLSSIDPNQVVYKFENFESIKKAKNKNILKQLLNKYESLGGNILSHLKSKLGTPNNIDLDFVFTPEFIKAINIIKISEDNKLLSDYFGLSEEEITSDFERIVSNIKNDKLADANGLLYAFQPFLARGGYLEKSRSYISKSEFQEISNIFLTLNGAKRQNVKRRFLTIVFKVYGNSNRTENFAEVIKKQIKPEKLKDLKIKDPTNFSTFVSIINLYKNPNEKLPKDYKYKIIDDIRKIIKSYEPSTEDYIQFSDTDYRNLSDFSYGNPIGDEEELYNIEDYLSLENKRIKKIRNLKLLKEAYSYLFKKKIISEGGLAGHMMHPYEALDMTPKQIIDRIKEYSSSQSIIEKVDGQNLFFTVEQDGTLMFARNKQDMTHNDLVKKFTNHPAEVPFISGGNAIKEGVDQWLASAGAFGSQEILDIFHPDGEAKSFINFEIMHKDHPNQLEYGENFIVFHSIVDFVNGREAVYSSNSSQRLQRIISLMKQGVESSGYTLASNRTVDLNSLTNVQILSYIERIKEIADMLDITINEFIGDGVEKQIKNQLDAEGINISDKAIKILYDFALYGEDKSGNKITSKDFTSLMDSNDVKKLRSIGLTNSSKAAAKTRSILSPFKEVFVDLGIDLLAGVSSSYMDSKTNLLNVNRLREKLETAIIDLHTYMKNTPENNWDSEVLRLQQHYDKVIEVGINNAVSTSVEGGVYDFHGDLLKVTGGFAPVNQILGAAYRDKKGIFTTFKEKFIKQESNKRSLKDVFNLIY